MSRKAFQVKKLRLRQVLGVWRLQEENSKYSSATHMATSVRIGRATSVRIGSKDCPCSGSAADIAMPLNLL